MNYEVELKFRVSDRARAATLIAGSGAVPGDVQQQCDTYFNHPARDFGTTGEAFRIRSVSDANRLTYKGPLLDSFTKSRREIEVECAHGDDGRQQLRELLDALGFMEVRSVTKRRTPYQLQYNGCSVELSIDEVDGLGTYVECETLASQETWESARDVLLELAGTMGFAEGEQKSYLELLIESDES